MDAGGGIFRQCFQNYCLDYQSGLVKMAALGWRAADILDTGIS